MNVTDVLNDLKAKSDPENIEGMKRYGIRFKEAYGVRVPELRTYAKKIKRNHELALELWATEIHDARLLATMIDDPKQVTESQMEEWVGDFDSWDKCDLCCSNLFDKTAMAYEKAHEWSQRDEEFVKRAGFVLMATLSVHDKKAADGKFTEFFPLIEKHSDDERNFVKKAVNWALRQIGKRNLLLNQEAILLAKKIREQDSKSAKWIAADALRELESEQVQKRLKLKKG